MAITARRGGVLKPRQESRQEAAPRMSSGRGDCHHWLHSAEAIAAGIVTWWIVAILLHSILLPTPWSTAGALAKEFTSSSERADVVITLERIIEGFAGGCVGGVIIGIVLGMSRAARFLVEPYQQFLRFVTPIAWVTPVSLWLGTGKWSLLVLVIYATVFPVSVNTTAAFGTLKPERVKLARSFADDDFLTVFRRVIFPSIIPQIATGMRLGLSYAFMTVIGLEMLVESSGLGNQIYQARVLYQSKVMMAGLLLLGVLGLGADRGFMVLRRRLLLRYEP